MARVASGAVLAFVCAAHLCPVAADERPRTIELTPYTAFRMGGSFEGAASTRDDDFELDDRHARGLLLDIAAATPNGYWEAAYGGQSTALDTHSAFAGAREIEVDVEYLQFGGLYVFEGRSVRPFVGLAAGVTRFDPAPPGFSAETFASGSLGGGIQLRADRRVGVRLEGRVLASLVDSDGELFCRSSGASNACAIVVEGDALVQWEVRAGLVVRF